MMNCLFHNSCRTARLQDLTFEKRTTGSNILYRDILLVKSKDFGWMLHLHICDIVVFHMLQH